MERSLADGIDTVTDQKENTNRFRQQTLPSRNHHELRRRGGVLPFFTSNDDTDRDEVGKTDRHEVYPHGERVGPRLFCPRTANRLTRRLLVSPAPDDVREAETALRVSLFFLSLSPSRSGVDRFCFSVPSAFLDAPPPKTRPNGLRDPFGPGFPFLHVAHLRSVFFTSLVFPSSVRESQNDLVESWPCSYWERERERERQRQRAEK